MEEEDIFLLHICGKQIMFRVTNIQIVRPEDVEILEIQPGKELVSLVTCTPYGINTHRLVVTGERYEETVEVEEIEVNVVSKRDIIFLALPILLLGMGIVIHRRKEVTE